jgi:UPF0716 protein FxsA
MRLLLAFIAVPLIEIGLFIQVGDYIGLWPTLLIVILTAIIGTSLVRSQGIQALTKLQNSFLTMQNPVEPLAHGAMILFAGALLLTPGFFTDFIGILLLFPQFRSFVVRQFRSRIKMDKFNFNHSEKYSSDDVIDGSFDEVTPRDSPSGWTKD